MRDSLIDKRNSQVDYEYVHSDKNSVIIDVTALEPSSKCVLRCPNLGQWTRDYLMQPEVSVYLYTFH